MGVPWRACTFIQKVYRRKFEINHDQDESRQRKDLQNKEDPARELPRQQGQTLIIVQPAFSRATPLSFSSFISSRTMPPKAKGKRPASSAVARTGPKEVFQHSSRRSKREEEDNKPTTQRALVLRNGNYGAQGTGEVILLNRMTGREKLDLLAGARHLLPFHSPS